MSDINLLPDDLRQREQAERQQAKADKSQPRFSHPQQPDKTESSSHQPPSRWQQFLSALKKNVAATPPTASQSPAIARSLKIESSKKAVSEDIVKSSSALPSSASSSPPPVTEQKLPPSKTPESPSKGRGVPPPPSVLDVNLIPAQDNKRLSGKTIAGLTAVILGAAAVVLVVFWALQSYAHRQQLENQKFQEAALGWQQQLEAARQAAETALVTRRRIQLLGEVLQQRVNWDNFFTFLEKHTLPTVQLNSLAADANGEVIISGVAPNFTEVGRQMLAFQQSSEATEVTLSGLTVDLGRGGVMSAAAVNFTFTLKLLPSLFQFNQ